ncbi:MAG: hypothetical protein K5770_17430 [Lachnospiraceae bacterium]|nr:hypothetical protein [Lachnospiraceae bacterium]
MKKLYTLLNILFILACLSGCMNVEVNIADDRTEEIVSSPDEDMPGPAGNETDSENPYAKPFPSEEAPKLYEPVYDRPLSYSNAVSYKISFSPVPEADSYEIALYAEGTDDYGRDFAVRNTKGMGGNESYADDGTVSIDCYFLQGVYTDTVTYRLKVRPVFYGNEYRRTDPTAYNWSNIWELKFTDGTGAASETEADFDEEIAEAQAAEEAKRKAEKEAEEKDENETAPVLEKNPLPHSFPEPLLEYLAREAGEEEPVSLSGLADISVNVNHCEYGEPTQIITDKTALEQFAKAVSEITVVEKEDEIFSTGTDTIYGAYDENGTRLLAFAIQDGLLEARDGRYSLSGLSGLLSVEGVMTPSDWEDYYEDYYRKASEYEEEVFDSGVEGMPLLDAAGYGTHIAGMVDAQMLSTVHIYIDWNNEAGELTTHDPEETAAVFDALKNIKVGKEAEDASGQMWHLYLSYRNPEHTFLDEAWLGFRGDLVEIGDDYYELEGLDGLYESVDCDVLNYLKENAETKPIPKISPVY